MNSILPDDILIQILTCSSPNTVATSRMASKHFRRIINQNFLWRPSVKEFNVELRQFEERNAPIGRIQFKKTNKTKKRLVVTLKNNNKSKAMVEECEEGPSTADTQRIAQAMRSVRLAERLSFDGVVADSSFMKMMTAPWNDLSGVKNLSFTLSRMRLSEAEMVRLLTRTSASHLTLDFCHHETDTLSDKVLSALPDLQSLRVQARKPVLFSSLTDNTLNSWAANTPTTVALLGGVSTSFTVRGIANILKINKNPLDWELGQVTSDEDTAAALLSLSMTQGVQVKISDDYRSKKIQINTINSSVVFYLSESASF